MAASGVRFIHAGDFQLDQPLGGVAEVPEHLRDLFISAPYRAAERVFDAAVAEEVSFLLLTGNLCRLERCSPPSTLFLLEQFERLAERGIDVYWAGGAADPPQAWPTSLRLPTNVHVFPAGRLAEYMVELRGVPAARIVGVSLTAPSELRPAEFHRDPAGLPTIAVACGEAETAMLLASEIDYWALGGRSSRGNLAAQGARRAESGARTALAHYPGSPQGRRPGEIGAYGCTLVDFSSGAPRTTFVPCSVARWVEHRLMLPSAASRGELAVQLRSAAQSLREESPQTELLVSWIIVGAGGLWREILRGTLADELLAELRDEFGRPTPTLYSVAMRAEPAATLPAAWYAEDSILGDYLRELRQCETDAALPLGLEACLSSPQLAGELASLAMLPEGAARRRVLLEAAYLGVDLLRPGADVAEAAPDEPAAEKLPPAALEDSPD